MRHTAHGYWLEEAGEIQPMPELVGERSADVVVIGGGFTGMWAAWHIKALEPEARVVLLEADGCGRGPSGRNGGFANTMWFSLASMRKRWGDEPALAVARAAEGAVAEIGAFCEREGVDAWFRRAGYLQVSTAPAHDGVWAEALAACRELGAADAIQPLSPAEVAARCASPAFRGGAFYPGAATVQPARLALGLRERLRASGVEVFESSPVTSLRDGPGGVEARTAAGSVRARAAVLAVGGAATSPHGPLRNRMTIASSHIVLTEPVPELLEEIGWTGGECITDSRALIDYFRTTPDGRILFGWGGGRIAMGARLGGRAELDAGVVALTAAHLRDCFPASASAASPTPGEARSTPRRPTCRWSCRCAAAAPSPPPATPATASALPTWSAGRSPRWPWTAATSTPACPSSTPRRRGCRRSPSSGSAPKRSASASCARRRRSWRGATPTRSAPPSPASQS